MKSNYNDLSYKRYRQYRANRHRYKVDQMAAPIAAIILITIFSKFWMIILGCLIIWIIYKIVNFINNHSSSSSTNTVTTFNEEKIGERSMEKTQYLKSTDKGYINRNNQRNNGKTALPGSDHMQWYYEMECTNCNHKYHANGSDIFQRKCPYCQGGRP